MAILQVNKDVDAEPEAPMKLPPLVENEGNAPSNPDAIIPPVSQSDAVQLPSIHPNDEAPSSSEQTTEDTPAQSIPEG